MSGFVRSNVVRKATVVKSGVVASTADSTNDQTSINSDEQTVQPVVKPVVKPYITLPIIGCRSWLHSLSYASSGCVDLDSLCSGGLFVHSLVCLIEDDQSFHRCLSRMFVVDGLAYKHKVLIVSTRASHKHMTANLPVQSSSKQIPTSQSQPIKPSTGQTTSQLKNAFRYESYIDKPQDSKSNMASSDRSERAKASVTLSKSYDLSRKVDQSMHENLHHIQVKSNNQSNHQSVYMDTLKQIATFLHQAQQDSVQAGVRNLTRVVVESVGDLDWGYESTEHARDLLLFVHGLRCLLARFDALCVLTFPASMYHPSVTQAVLRSCQYGFELRPLPLSSPYRDHDALLYVHNMHTGHSLAPFADHKEWLVALRRRVTIEKVSLPPELSRDEESQHTNRANQVNQAVKQTINPSNNVRGQISMEEDETAAIKPRVARTSRVGCGTGKGDGNSKFDF